ncbi:MAG: MFS transporter permease [Gammaproteobacteria bacterium]|jgi:hypothetical protein|nr:MFS transporter permease [Gammaproteobacteria bacterium]
MSGWQTYRLQDFIPFTPEVYWRLLERVNEAFWPLHLLTAVLGLTALVFALRGHARVALLLAAPAWISSGVIFHLMYYAELNWAAPWFGRAFVFQAILLVVIATFSTTAQSNRKLGGAGSAIGAAIAAGALLFYPFIAVGLGPGVANAEAYGLHPDPTAIATLGIVLIALRGAAAWLALLIPFVWCLTSTLTLIALDAGWCWLPLFTGVLAIVILVVRALARFSDDSTNPRP